MSDTCIVCLGDLRTKDSASKDLQDVVQRDEYRANGVRLDHDGNVKEISLPSTPLPLRQTPDKDLPINGAASTADIAPGDGSDCDIIAHLKPCGHNLHNECLRPWVERANSCPICRQNFNIVELTNSIDGPIVSTYNVEDRTQVAEVDPTLYIEDDDLEETEDDGLEECDYCGSPIEEGDLIICVGCDALSHTHCAGFERIPREQWYCDNCQDQRPLESFERRVAQRQIRQRSQATRRNTILRRRAVNRGRQANLPWTRVWEAVSNRLDLDLEFPFEDDGSLVSDHQPLYNSQDRRMPWQRRLRIAEQNGAASEFQAEAPIPEVPRLAREQPHSVEPESQEELRAWNAFDKAQEMANKPAASQRRKRKRTTTPSPEPSEVEQHEHRLKRPRTRRSVNDAGNPSRIPPNINTAITNPSADAGSPSLPSAAVSSRGPTFFQNLLHELNDYEGPKFGGTLTKAAPSTANYSAASSPTASNHPSPIARATTPPLYSSRTGSPVPLSSKIEPNFAAPQFSPTRSPRSRSSSTTRQRANSSEIHQPRPTRPVTRQGRPQRVPEISPSRATMSMELKSDISKMVSNALQPYYQEKRITKDEFTIVNRDVSRLLYERVGKKASMDQAERTEWEAVAVKEVEKAVEVQKWPSAGGLTA